MYLLLLSYNFPCVLLPLTLTASTYPKKKKRQVSRIYGISDDDYGSDININETKVTNNFFQGGSRGVPQNKKQEGERTERAVGVAVRKTELETTFVVAEEAFVLCETW